MPGKMKTMFYGGDYNPNQWPDDILTEDIRLFQKAHINSATLNVFSWAKIQPSENTYDFSYLDRAVSQLTENGIEIVMATSTAALPAWMVKTHPEVMYTDYEGRRHVFGQRHNFCPNSAVYRDLAGRLVRRLAEKYARHPGVTAWHVNNEYGTMCYCENCQAAFRLWLQKKYHTLDAVNAAWNLEFWGHTVYDWDEIVAPNALGDGIGTEKTAFAGLSLDWRRFMSDSVLECYCLERDLIKEFNPDALVTTNLMGTFKGLDYFKWAKEMDIISWDHYPAYDTPWSYSAMCHDLMRGLKATPFLLMEQTPSQQNWQKYNSLKRPGQMRAQSCQSIAHGADSIQFFQLRRSIGGCEKFHGAVIAHVGTDNTRVFREVSELGAELEKISPSILGSTSRADVGLIFDWDNYWALEYTSGPTEDLSYVDQIHRFYRYFYDRHFAIDLIPADADFSRYKVICAPVLYLFREGMQPALEAFVRNGGILITTYMSGLVDQSDNVITGGYPGPLRRLAGIWVEEIDALAPEQTNTAVFSDGTASTCSLLCDIIHTEGADALAVYGSDFYAGTPVITGNSFGAGSVIYFGSQTDETGLDHALADTLSKAGVRPVIPEQTKLEVTCRYAGNQAFFFVINLSLDAQPLPPSLAGMTDLITGKQIPDGTVLNRWDVLILCRE